MKILYEVLPIKTDVKALKQHLINVVFKAGPPVIQGIEFGYEVFGGWSLQSRTGDYRDGWQMSKDSQTYTDEELKQLKQKGYGHPFEHKNYTDICTGYVRELIEQVDQMGFYPRRARITMSKHHTKSITHSDMPATQYGARIHIPIVSHSLVYHETEYGSFHMEPGNVYIIWVNNMHRIVNDSSIDRYHIIMDAYDTKHVTEHFKYDGNVQDLIQQSVDLRARIDSL